MDAESLTLSLRCPGLGVAALGAFAADGLPRLPRLLAPGERRGTQLLHAKRDGQVCFMYADELTGAEFDDVQSAGGPGDIFVFGGDAGAGVLESRGQVLIVYGEDHLFVEPFDRGFTPRGYRRIGSFADAGELARLGEHIWRHGFEAVELEVTHGG